MLLLLHFFFAVLFVEFISQILRQEAHSLVVLLFVHRGAGLLLLARDRSRDSLLLGVEAGGVVRVSLALNIIRNFDALVHLVLVVLHLGSIGNILSTMHHLLLLIWLHDADGLVLLAPLLLVGGIVVHRHLVAVGSGVVEVVLLVLASVVLVVLLMDFLAHVGVGAAGLHVLQLGVVASINPTLSPMLMLSLVLSHHGSVLGILHILQIRVRL